jgi:hypothetical protein
MEEVRGFQKTSQLVRGDEGNVATPAAVQANDLAIVDDPVPEFGQMGAGLGIGCGQRGTSVSCQFCTALVYRYVNRSSS